MVSRHVGEFQRRNYDPFWARDSNVFGILDPVGYQEYLCRIYDHIGAHGFHGDVNVFWSLGHVSETRFQKQDFLSFSKCQFSVFVQLTLILLRTEISKGWHGNVTGICFVYFRANCINETSPLNQCKQYLPLVVFTKDSLPWKFSDFFVLKKELCWNF